jgi:hypothetical protein
MGRNPAGGTDRWTISGPGGKGQQQGQQGWAAPPTSGAQIAANGNRSNPTQP